MTVPRQTLSYIRNLLASRGINPKNKLGQNFLIDLNLIDVILREANLGSDDLAWEVGSGTGTLTGRLAESAGAVVSVEIDPAFYLLTSEVLAHRSNVRLINADVLRTKNELNPAVVSALDEMSSAHNCKRRKLVANLPYVVATPVIANTLIAGLGVVDMVVMVQWEIAERMTANPSEKAHGALAVLTQSVADVTVVRKLPPEVFWPRPKVESAIVKVTPNSEKRARVGDVAQFRAFLRDLYTHRRKNLRGALVGCPTGRREKADVDGTLRGLGIDGNIRAETLDVEQHLRLCTAFAKSDA